MDDFDLILENTFKRTVRVEIFPQPGGILIMNKEGASFVCSQGGPYRVEDRTFSEEQLSALQIARGARKEP